MKTVWISKENAIKLPNFCNDQDILVKWFTKFRLILMIRYEIQVKYPF